MKILFCDLCNESVPQSELDEGRAFMRKGRVVETATKDRLLTTPRHDYTRTLISAVPSLTPPRRLPPPVSTLPRQPWMAEAQICLLALPPWKPRPPVLPSSRRLLW